MVNAVTRLLDTHADVRANLERKTLIRQSLDNKEALPCAAGAMVTWTPTESTGRSPKDTVAVKRSESEDTIDWDSPNNIPINSETFDMLFEDAIVTLGKKQKCYVLDRVLGADTSYALPVKTVTDQALAALFADNMFRPVPGDMSVSVFKDRPFTVICLPYDKLDPKRYEGRLRVNPDTGQTSTMAIAMDFDRRFGIVYGSAYGGSLKKLMFTVMNYMLPAEGVLPLHASANEGPDGKSTLFLGLSGTGKTTLSADPNRALLGDDEHGWNENGIANFEYGCYAKMINIDPSREPEIYNAVMHQAPYLEHGAIVENAMMYPDGSIDYYDNRLTENSRASYPLRFLSNIKESSKSSHPGYIIFLTADANGVLPPVARLSDEQAMLWFLIGYTSKLAGTETGIVDPVATFSRFFGEPFMPRNPDVYAGMLGEKLRQHDTRVYLVNTGWSGGPFGVGKRMDINLTRAILDAIMAGSLDDITCCEDPVFHLMVPDSCPGIDDPTVLHPRNTWQDKNAYDERAKKLAGQFSAHYDKAYGSKGIDNAIKMQCPGK
jgi:phosphoenolpyruvate carboxykinase (ATP)